MIRHQQATPKLFALSEVPVGSLVHMHHGIDGPWEIVAHLPAPALHPEMGDRLDVRRPGEPGKAHGVPLTYVKEIVKTP